MSRSTPRKQKGNNAAGSGSLSHPHGHARTRSQHLQAQAQLAQTSDYESDTPYYMSADPSVAADHLANRGAMSITDLNLSVLKRYLPSIIRITHSAVNGVVYTFSYTSMTWERGTVEGTVFVCLQAGSHDLDHNACVVVLNRKGLDNFILDLSTVSSFEFNGELFIFKMDDPSRAPDYDQDPQPGSRIYGVWTHYDDIEDRKSTAAEINELWAGVRAAKEQRQASGLDYQQEDQDAQMGPALQALGRRLSLSALFGPQSGA